MTGMRDRLDDLVDHGRVGHARDAAGRADVGGHALERHDGDGAGVLGDLGLLGGDDVHDDAALEHLGEAGLDAKRAGLLGVVCHVATTPSVAPYRAQMACDHGIVPMAPPVKQAPGRCGNARSESRTTSW